MIRQLVVVGASILVCLGSTAHAAVGDVDPSFNGYGSTRFDKSRLAIVQAIRELPDERLMVAGWTVYASTNKGSVARLLADGEPDSAFGAFGVSTTVVGSGSRFYDVLADPDGSAIAVGWTYNPSWKWLVQRFDATGALDPTFGTGGTTITTIDGSDRAWRIERLGDGRLIVVGETCPAYPTCDVVIGRYTANGILDPTFGTGGIVRTSLHASGYEAGPNVRLVMQPDGKLVLGIGGRLLRVLSDGSPDLSFGTAGVAVVPNGSANEVALLPDGKILVALENNFDSPLGVARVLANGTLDTAFGTDGFANGGSQALAVESDGSIVTTENSAPCVLRSDDQDSSYECGMPIFRNRPDGSVDTTFGPGGTGFGALGATNSTGHAMLVRANGKVLGGGGSLSGGGAVTQWSVDGCLQAIKPSISFTGLTKSKWAVKAKATLQVPGLSTFDPATDGVRVRLRGGSFGQIVMGGFTLPGGTGWSKNSKNTSWKFKGGPGAPGGVATLKLVRKTGAPAPLKFSMKTKDHFYYADDNYFPVRFEVDLDVAAPTNVECSVGSFFLGYCDQKFDSFGSTSAASCK